LLKHNTYLLHVTSWPEDLKVHKQGTLH